MSSWLISVPVWGGPYVEVFTRYAVPALQIALKGLRGTVRFLVHTDAPEPVASALRDYSVDLRIIHKQGTSYNTLQAAHSEAIQYAKHGDRVALLNADLVVSRNLFESCDTHLSTGKKAIALCGIRTVKDPANPPPIGAQSRELLEWAWHHRHQIVRDLEWPHGGSKLPTNLFFVRPAAVVLHGFHLHPIAVLKDKDIAIKSTIDGDLLDFYQPGEIHVVTSPDDMGMLEMSDPARRFPVRNEPLTPLGVARSMATRSSARHRWLFQHRIVVCGDAGVDCGDTRPVEQILEILRQYPAQF